ncbi:MAG: hypothetical protein E7314_00675 [Clostridiales bacterium]|nr:hypothetical protein [Clostridiales bacterium]
MGFLFIGIALVICGVYLLKYCKGSEKTYILKGVISFICVFSAIFFCAVSFTGNSTTEANKKLISTNELVGIKHDDFTYSFLDENGNSYYLTDEQIIVVKNGKVDEYECRVIKGEYDKAFVEEYNVDYQMNFWTFAFADGKECIIYIPNDMKQIN